LRRRNIWIQKLRREQRKSNLGRQDGHQRGTAAMINFNDKGTTMNTLRKSILIGFTVLGMAAAHAQEAQPAKPARRASSKEQMQAKMADMYAKRQARLHDLLKLTTQQESAWATYQAAIKPAA
jgi:alkylation response protein AidB-like acyl-CoA dehydrogenase